MSRDNVIIAHANKLDRQLGVCYKWKWLNITYSGIWSDASDFAFM